MSSQISMFTWAGKIFAGKLVSGPAIVINKMTDVVELIPGMNNQGQMVIIGVKIGEFIIKDISTFEHMGLDKDSLYYKAYYQTTTGLQVVRNN